MLIIGILIPVLPRVRPANEGTVPAAPDSPEEAFQAPGISVAPHIPTRLFFRNPRLLIFSNKGISFRRRVSSGPG
jgi:hypothetical protein